MGNNLSDTTDYYGASSSSSLYSFARILYGSTNSSNPNNPFTQPWVIAHGLELEQPVRGGVIQNVGDPWTMGGGIQTMLTEMGGGVWDSGPNWFQGVLTSNNVLMTNVLGSSYSDQVTIFECQTSRHIRVYEFMHMQMS